MMFFRNFPGLLSDQYALLSSTLILGNNPEDAYHDHPDSSFEDKIPPKKEECMFVPILNPTWKPVFLHFTMKLLIVLSNAGHSLQGINLLWPPLYLAKQ